ncbi:MAG TPA: outer membrane beta-barrel protein [Candidatus Paceibacterota bacterium]|nr:outer membrane beta-barrel protein [Verrucomicrobiota bacterium]HSA09298.1 outer membrane beta-barrel protein [Candidatus Paceibacterota bacterium]
MNYNSWTKALAGIGLVTLPAVAVAEEQPSALMTGLASTTLGGYVDTSAQWNFGTGNANTPPYAFGGTSKADGFNLNVVKLALERPVDIKDGWAAGYKVELLFGPDANTLATQSSGTAADFGIKQAYAALHAPIGNGMDFKVGVWDTIIGYEVTDAIANANFTRSYGYTIEPPAHTGIQAAYQISEACAAIAGVANTFGPKINERAFLSPTNPQAESYKTYMGSIALTAPQSWGFLAGSMLCGCVINGFSSGANAGNGANQTSWYVGATINTPLSGLRLGAAYDYAGVSRQDPFGANYANAVALYASYQATERLSLHARGEYASSDAQTAGATPLLGATKVFATTATVRYDLWKNVLSRIEFRWDHAAGGQPAYGGTTPGAPTLKNSYMLLANIAYTF